MTKPGCVADSSRTKCKRAGGPRCNHIHHIGGRTTLMLAAVNLLSLAVCQDYCINPCCDLTGSPSRECNSCTDTTFAGDPRLPSNGTNGWCRPGMPNYLESERHGDMSDTAQCREHHRNINRGGHDPGISMGAVFGVFGGFYF